MINPEKMGPVAYTEALEFGAWRQKKPGDEIADPTHVVSIDGVLSIPVRFYGPDPIEASINPKPLPIPVKK